MTKFFYRPPELKLKFSFVYLAVAGWGCWYFHEFIFTPNIVLTKEYLVLKYLFYRQNSTERPTDREKMDPNMVNFASGWKSLEHMINGMSKKWYFLGLCCKPMTPPPSSVHLGALSIMPNWRRAAQVRFPVRNTNAFPALVLSWVAPKKFRSAYIGLNITANEMVIHSSKKIYILRTELQYLSFLHRSLNSLRVIQCTKGRVKKVVTSHDFCH